MSSDPEIRRPSVRVSEPKEIPKISGSFIYRIVRKIRHARRSVTLIVATVKDIFDARR